VLVDLADDGATDGSLVGAKAANLARARRAGLPVLPGLVLTTAWDSRGWSHPSRGDELSPPRIAWQQLTGGGHRPVVVRSSSTGEDGGSSSMAGVFESVLDVVTWDDFALAVDRVLDSGRRAAVPGGRMAVLVQPQLRPRWGGVVFGADPVSGRADRLLLSAVEGGPDRLVSGLDDGWTAVLSRRGRVLETRGRGGAPLPRHHLRALARLAARAAGAFGGPQDVEWAIDHDGTLWLLQSRPITTVTGTATGPVLGTGPLAETFPEPLGPLEVDLWLRPLGEGLEQALLLTGTASARALRRSPVVREVDGWPVADLVRLGVVPERHPWLRRLDPRPPARRVGAAWRTGRLGRALPALARDVIEQVDADLAAVPALHELSDGELLSVLDTGRTALRALHGYEALAGMLVPADGEAVTAAALALDALADARGEGIGVDELVARDPVVLALAPPRVGGDVAIQLGPVDTIDLRDGAPTLTPVAEPTDEAAVVREALRLRARWVQELTARAAWELGRRLVRAGVIDDRATVRRMTVDELRAAVRSRTVPADLAERTDPATDRPKPLPARFRLTATGVPVAVAPPTADPAGVGAGGGVGSGPVHIGDDPPAGAVLVVAHLDPRLATVVPRLGGLVAETGSPLSHLAILAREHGVPTVVGHEGATARYAPGQTVEVDGTTGTVRALEGAGADRHPAATPASGEAPAGPDAPTGDRPARAEDGAGTDGHGRQPARVVPLPRRVVVSVPADPDDPATDDGDRADDDRAGTVIPIGARR